MSTAKRMIEKELDAAIAKDDKVWLRLYAEDDPDEDEVDEDTVDEDEPAA